jgi:hypothetical protein
MLLERPELTPGNFGHLAHQAPIQISRNKPGNAVSSPPIPRWLRRIESAEPSRPQAGMAVHFAIYNAEDHIVAGH